MFGMKKVKQPEEMQYSAEELLTQLIDDYTTIKQPVLMQMRRGVIGQVDFIDDARSHLKKYYHPDAAVLEQTLILFEQNIFGYSVLTPLINDPEISDIRCISCNDIRVKRKGRRGAAEVRFCSDTEYRHFVELVATKNQVNISNRNAIQRFTDNKSNQDYILRFTVMMPLITSRNPYLCIRKVPIDFPEIQDLIKEDMLTVELAELLVERFRATSTIICGGNSSGKTTLLNALKETLPEDKSVLVTQQAEELTTKQHPDMMFSHSLPGNGESEVSYDLEDISIAGLTMDIDYFIIGEVKGREAAHLLNAAYTGQICSGTVHAPSADKAADKIIDYAISEGHYSKKELQKMMTCFETFVFMKDYKVAQVYKLQGWNPDTEELEYTTIFERGKI